jgi:hypothetical protein
LIKLCARKDVGAVVVLGSELVNPMAGPIARRMFNGRAASDLPARFRWSFAWEGRDPFLSDPTPCTPGDEGIAFTGTGKKTLLRTRDEVILRRARSSRKAIFLDCGVLAIDSRADPLLVLCAGHGGCGTRAAVLGLARTTYLEDRLLESAQGRGLVGNRRVFEPLWVRRTKASHAAVDDLTFDETYGVGWGFEFDAPR